ncbi:LacI family DNA-binding transcriptional regulator [Arthrobacter sp. NPDC056727]|uniref:LacI family DNA-binding transcriptional regulator n=1 Tax=Arthrobacter sp. NPDC056727 TaxID=3345927 RepID=UPI00366A57DF
MTEHVTLKDVAAHAGVSRTTASYVVTGTGRMSQKTRDRVHASIKELGYVYNRGAASLRTQRSSTIGVVVTNISSPFFGELLVGLEGELRAHGFLSLVVATGDDPTRQEQLIAELREHQIAGLAAVPASGSSPDLLDAIRASGTPHVFMTRYLEGEPAPYIGPDDVQGGRLAAQHLLEHGCRTIAYLGGRDIVLSRRDRLDGVRNAIADAGLDEAALTDIQGDATGEAGLAAGEQLLAAGPLPDGVICHSDSVAFGFYRALRVHGVPVESVRVIGYDDIRGAALWEPPLTSVATHAERLGKLSARKLLAALGALNAPTADLVEKVAPELIVRQSCGCP